MNPLPSTVLDTMDWTDDGSKVKSSWISKFFYYFLFYELVVRIGWFPWMDGKDVKQIPGYSNLCQVSSDMKTCMDEPSCGGPAFRDIVIFLEVKNIFDDDVEGFCDKLLFQRGRGRYM
jgi:hypothetical protein